MFLSLVAYPLYLCMVKTIYLISHIPVAMFRNYFKIALRQLFKQKFFSFINIAGLALSVACCLLIALFVHNELSYDTYHEHADDIYRLALDINLNQSVAKGTALPAPAAHTIKEEFPEVINACRINRFFFNAGTNLVRTAKEKESTFQEKFVYVDHSFTEMFDFTPLYGDSESWLLEPYTIVITKRVAEQFFPQVDPVGEQLVLNDDTENQSYRVTGVIDDMPSHSHLDFDYLMSMTTLNASQANDWVSNNYYSYVQLAPGTDPEQLNAKLIPFGLQYFGPQFREQLKVDLEQVTKTGSKYDLFLQPLADIHLHSDHFTPNFGSGGDIRYIQLFTVIGLFLLLIAIVNYVNLSTARSANRAREVGMRKVLGSFQVHLIGQFLMESIMVSFLAFGFGLLLAELLLPAFNALAHKNLIIPYHASWFVLILASSTLGMGVLAGIYPAFYLSGFKPIKVLKGQLSLGKNSAWLRKGLVVVQFTISTALIIGTLVVFNQMKYIQQKKIGFEKDQVLLIHDTYTLDTRIGNFKEAVKDLAEVQNASISPFLPGAGGFRNQIMYNAEENTDPADQIPLQAWPVDTDYIPTLGIQLKEGRNFSPDRPADSLATIISETAVKQLGLADPVGKRIQNPFSDDLFTIIGVVEDFHFESLKSEIYGLALFLGNRTATISLRANTDNWDHTIAQVEQTWKRFAPNQAFRYSFLDERFHRMYQQESSAAALFNAFTLIAIFIACLGLFALASFTAEQRRKEIGIRKVLGATIGHVVGLLSKDFLRLVILAILIAIPVAWHFSSRWLQNFAYHIDLDILVFLCAGVAAILIALGTISFQSIRAAAADPIQALRSE